MPKLFLKGLVPRNKMRHNQNDYLHRHLCLKHNSLTNLRSPRFHPMCHFWIRLGLENPEYFRCFGLRVQLTLNLQDLLSKRVKKPLSKLLLVSLDKNRPGVHWCDSVELAKSVISKVYHFLELQRVPRLVLLLSKQDLAWVKHLDVDHHRGVDQCKLVINWFFATSNQPERGQFRKDLMVI